MAEAPWLVPLGCVGTPGGWPRVGTLDHGLWRPGRYSGSRPLQGYTKENR